MDIEYLPHISAVSVSFEQAEAGNIARLLWETLEEAKEKKMHLPDFNNAWMHTFLSSTTGTKVIFNFGFLEFGMLFLDNVYENAVENKEDTSQLRDELNRIWEEVSPYCVMDSTLH